MSNILKADLLLETSNINSEQVIDRTFVDDLNEFNNRREYILRQVIRKSQHIENEALKRAKALVDDAYEKSRLITAEAERKGYEKGYAQGLKDGAESAGKDAMAGLNEISSLIELIKRQKREALHREEKSLLAIAFEMAKKIIKKEAQIDRDIIPKMLEDIILENEGALRIYLSEYHRDLDLHIDKSIIDKIRSEAKNKRVVMVPMEDVIMVETEKGIVDMNISEQLKQLKAACEID